MKMGHYFPENPFDKADLALNPEKYPEAWEEYDKRLGKFIETTREKGLDLVVIISPDKYQLYDWGYPLYQLKGTRAFQDHIIEILEQKKVEYVDLLPVFEERIHDNKALFVTYGLYDEHQGDIGQLIKAEEVGKRVRKIMAQKGIMSLYHEFDKADITSPDKTGNAYKSRGWVSEDDNVGIALEGNVTLAFEKIVLGKKPRLSLDVVIPWWAEPNIKGRSMSLEVYVADADTDEGKTVLIKSYEEAVKPSNHIIDLGQWENKETSIAFTLKWNLPEGEAGDDTPPRILISSPVISAGSPKGTLKF
jgi:hypothetical protein